MTKLKVTLKNLSLKRSFYQEQVDYYNQYVKTCRDNLSTKTKLVALLYYYSTSTYVYLYLPPALHSTNRKADRKSTMFERKKPLLNVKYSASRLYEKGILLEIQDLNPSQLVQVIKSHTLSYPSELNYFSIY